MSTAIDGLKESTALVPHTAELVPSGHAPLVRREAPRLPSIEDMQERMVHQKAMRQLLVQYMQSEMDPKRHLYAVVNGKVVPADDPEAKGVKPGLTQDGAYNLMSLFGAAPGMTQFAIEPAADGHFTVRATVPVVHEQSGEPWRYGHGSCTTREAKYAYRWVFESQLPRGANKATMKTKSVNTRRGQSFMYRLENEDLGDLTHTISAMAEKRAIVNGTRKLPLVSELVCEEEGGEDEVRKEVLRQLGEWLRPLKSDVRANALGALCGLRLPKELDTLSTDALEGLLDRVHAAIESGIAWHSRTLQEDLKALQAKKAAQAITELFDPDDAPISPENAPNFPPGVSTHSPGGVDATTGELVGEDGTYVWTTDEPETGGHHA